MPVLTYEEAGHIYRLDNRWIPGITRVLADCGYTKGMEFMPASSRSRGTQVHKACVLVDQHCPEARTIDEVLEIVELGEKLIPYVQEWLLVKKELGLVPWKHEFQVYSLERRVAGTVDWYGFSTVLRKKIELDWKSWASQGAKPKRSAELQTQFYADASKESLGLEVEARFVVKLPGDGSKPRVYRCENPRDAHVVLANCVQWWDRAEAGLIKAGGESEVELAA